MGQGKGYSWGLGLTLLCSANPSYSNNFIRFGFASLQGSELFVRRKNLTLTQESQKFTAREFIAVFQERSFYGHA